MQGFTSLLSRLFLFGNKTQAKSSDNASLFQGDRLRLEGKVAVLFTVDWCPYCRSFEKAWQAWSAPEGVERVRVDLSDESDPLWEVFGVDIVPTVALFENGKLTWRQDGRAGVGLRASDLETLTAKAQA